MPKKCPVCGFDNPDDAEYCANCGYEFVGSGDSEENDDTATATASSIGASTSIPTLILTLPDNKTFTVTKEVTIGRRTNTNSVDIDLTDYDDLQNGPFVSRKHAKIYYDNQSNQWMIIDLGSTNGTKVNNNMLNPQTPNPLKDGDEITLARVVIKVSTK